MLYSACLQLADGHVFGQIPAFTHVEHLMRQAMLEASGSAVADVAVLGNKGHQAPQH